MTSIETRLLQRTSACVLVACLGIAGCRAGNDTPLASASAAATDGTSSNDGVDPGTAADTAEPDTLFGDPVDAELPVDTDVAGPGASKIIKQCQVKLTSTMQAGQKLAVCALLCWNVTAAQSPTGSRAPLDAANTLATSRAECEKKRKELQDKIDQQRPQNDTSAFDLAPPSASDWDNFWAAVVAVVGGTWAFINGAWQLI